MSTSWDTSHTNTNTAELLATAVIGNYTQRPHNTHTAHLHKGGMTLTYSLKFPAAYTRKHGGTNRDMYRQTPTAKALV